MELLGFSAFATTRDVEPGRETSGADGRIHARDRVFTDIVESDDPRIAGINEVRLAVDLDPRDGSGSVWGSFELHPSAGGSWRGSLTGLIVGGIVQAQGLAIGSSDWAGWVMRVDFRQVPAHPGSPPCAEPKAFFEINGRLMPSG